MDLNESGSFNNKVFVVTGGTQGLGAAVARLLSERGARGIVICGRNAIAGREQAEVLSHPGCEVIFVEADISSPEACMKVVEVAESAFGTLHGLVNCAGMSDRGTILDTTPELFDAIMAVNIRAPFFLMQAAIKMMIAKGVEGSIVNIITMTSMAVRAS